MIGVLVAEDMTILREALVRLLSRSAIRAGYDAAASSTPSGQNRLSTPLTARDVEQDAQRGPQHEPGDPAHRLLIAVALVALAAGLLREL